MQPPPTRSAACGAARILGVAGAEFAQPRYATDAAAAEALAQGAGATIVLAPATSRWARVMPGVAHRLNGVVDTHATDVAAAGGAVRDPLVLPPAHGGRPPARQTPLGHPGGIGLPPGMVG